ncbi:MAG: dGTPase [Legionellales bacterium RIFCSPHIGHO2_12_FULL_42_9]|nr:MAG: dGTPase [Legionellales bacterium RIFCSPHIGHO2_12_FULL_42_9]
MWTHRRSGLHHQRSAEDHREPYERDKTRVIHCPAFRRLQRKTQILGADSGDFHRTRLTHSLEVASIACSIVRNLASNPETSLLAGILPNEDLISTISLLHDIGHPPFGHSGEVALNLMMREAGGFESNGQTLRLLTKLETSYGTYGLDLTRRSLLGILKYPVNRNQVVAPIQPELLSSQHPTCRINDWLPPKAYFNSEQAEIDWLLSPFNNADRELFQSLQKVPQGQHHGESAYHTFDCSIMDIADDIAYGVHDLEDAIHLQLITRDQVDNAQLRACLHNSGLASPHNTLLNQLFSPDIHLRKQAIGTLVNYLITSIQCVTTDEAFHASLFKHNIALSAEAKLLLDYLKDTIYHYVISAPSARDAEHHAQSVIIRLFDTICASPQTLLEAHSLQNYNNAKNELEGFRVICDFIANMTDEGAYRMHGRLMSEYTVS